VVTLQRRVNQSPTRHIYSPVGAVSISIAALANEHGPPILDQYLLSMSDADRKPEQESSNQSEVYESFFPNSHFALNHSAIDVFDHEYNITSHCVNVSEINQRANMRSRSQPSFRSRCCLRRVRTSDLRRQPVR
jgi:hypothetical protein